MNPNTGRSAARANHVKTLCFPLWFRGARRLKKQKKTQVSALCTMHHMCLYGMTYLQCNGSKKHAEDKKKKEKTPLGPFFVYPHTHLCKQTQQ